MGIGSIFGSAAFRELLRLSPQIIAAADQVFKTVASNRREGARSDTVLSDRIATLEAADLAQAELLTTMAKQLGAQTKTLEAMAARQKSLVVLAGGALVAALLAMAFALTR